MVILVLSMPRFTTHIEVHLNPLGARRDPRTTGRVHGFEPGYILVVRLEEGRLVHEPLEKSSSLGGKVQAHCRRSGKTTQASM
jgi:hypothetical protein